jgi:hypothetical protein
VPGNGGKIEFASVEICSSVALNAPSLIKNNPMQLAYGQTVTVTNDFLEVQDADNTAAELIYTVVKSPTKGFIYLNGNEIFEGSTFTQEDINNGNLKYWTYASDLDINDGFNFTVIDGLGGFIPNNTFVFEIQNVSSTTDILRNKLVMYPNPATNAVYIETASEEGLNSLEILNSNGMKVFEGSFDRSTNLDLTRFVNGIYILSVKNEKSQYVEKLIINK